VAVLTTAREVLDAQPALGLDYVALVDPITLRDVGPGFAGTALLALAAKVGRTRLIDNAEIELGSADG
jgi:pantoate--beta-alanine ligase